SIRFSTSSFDITEKSTVRAGNCLPDNRAAPGRPIDDPLESTESLAPGDEALITMSLAPVPRKNGTAMRPPQCGLLKVIPAPSRSTTNSPSQCGQLKTMSRSLTVTTESGAGWAITASDSTEDIGAARITARNAPDAKQILNACPLKRLSIRQQADFRFHLYP